MTASAVSRRVRRRAPPGGGRFVDVVFPVSPLAPLARALRHHPARRQGRRPALSRLLRARRGATLRSLQAPPAPQKHARTRAPLWCVPRPVRGGGALKRNRLVVSLA